MAKDGLRVVSDRNTFDATVYDTMQVFVPAEIRERFGIMPQMKIKLAVLAVVEETRREVPLKQLKEFDEDKKKVQ